MTRRSLFDGRNRNAFSSWDDEDCSPAEPLEPDVSPGADGFEDDNTPTDPNTPNPLTGSPTILIGVKAMLEGLGEPAHTEADRRELDNLVGAEGTAEHSDAGVKTSFEDVVDEPYASSPSAGIDPDDDDDDEDEDESDSDESRTLTPTIGANAPKEENTQTEKPKKSWWGRLTSGFSSALKAVGLFAAVTVGADTLNSVKNQTPEEPSTPSSAQVVKTSATESAPAQVEAGSTKPKTITEAPTPQTISTETASEQAGTLWNHLLEQNHSNELQAAQAKNEYLRQNGASIVDSVESDWIDAIEDNAQLWKDTIRPNLKKWGFDHSSLGMAHDIENAQTLRDLLQAQRNHANWLEAEAVLMFRPDAWKSLNNGGSVETDDSAGNALPDIQEDAGNAGDDLDLTPFIELPKSTQTIWYFNADDEIIDPSINNNEDEEDDLVLPEPDSLDDIAPEDLQPIEFGPFDAPEPRAFIQAQRNAQNSQARS